MNKIISFVMVGSNNLEKSSKFYDAVFVHLGIKKVTTTERYIGYGHSNDPNEVKFYITKPYNKKPATIGNGTMIALLAESNEAVDKLHATALENGAVDEGSPGIREDGNYYAYVRDLDGNKITAKCISN
jgi:predicted lactoylglutathione lyase|tara:strand:- start:1057 stop:1443 length:387 start_codon:yes stop_codon:yes gene_type:complete